MGDAPTQPAKYSPFNFWKSSHPTETSGSDGQGTTVASGRITTFWPYDLLKDDCKNVRILTFGYDSAVSNFFSGVANKSHIFGHSRALLAGLKHKRFDCVRSHRFLLLEKLGTELSLAQ